jgi:hypothetical protein
MQLIPSTSEQAILAELRQLAALNYGGERAAELDPRLADAAHALWLIAQQPFDLLDEEPDRDGC